MSATWTEPAAARFEAAVEFVARTRPSAAGRLMEDVLAAVEHLAAFPHSGRTPPERPRSPLREAVCGDYRIVYERRGRDVVIIWFQHQRQRFPARIPRSAPRHTLSME